MPKQIVETIMVLCDGPELRRLLAGARAAGMPVADWVKAQALAAAPPPPPDKTR